MADLRSSVRIADTSSTCRAPVHAPSTSWTIARRRQRPFIVETLEDCLRILRAGLYAYAFVTILTGVAKFARAVLGLP